MNPVDKAMERWASVTKDWFWVIVLPFPKESMRRRGGGMKPDLGFVCISRASEWQLTSLTQRYDSAKYFASEEAARKFLRRIAESDDPQIRIDTRQAHIVKLQPVACCDLLEDIPVNPLIALAECAE